jgi:AraC family transcriptional activator of pobA
MRQLQAGSEIPEFSIYGEADATPAARFLYAEPLADTNRIHSWNIRPHRHRRLFQLFLVESGEGEGTLDGRAEWITAPALITVPPSVVHGFRFRENSDGLILSVADTFYHDLLRVTGDAAIAAAAERAAIRPVLAAQVGPLGLDRAFHTVAEELWHARLARTTMIAASLLQILAVLARLDAATSSAVTGDGSPAAALFARFRERVEEHYQDDWSVRDYAAALATTERTLRRATAHCTGESPLAVVHQRIMLEARRRLVYTALPVAQIAYSLGFTDPAYFTRFFAERTGESPAAFRRSALAEDLRVGEEDHGSGVSSRL